MKETFDYIYLYPFERTLIIYCGDEYKGILKYLNKKSNKFLSDYVRSVTKTKRLNVEIATGTESGFVHHFDDIPLILFIKKKKKKDWDYYGTILHEVTHIVDRLLDIAHASDEKEFRAYLTENLFKKVRQTIK